MRRWYKALSVFLCMVILTFAMMSPASAVSEIALVAGGVMTLGLVASIVICAGAGAGMSGAINQTAAENGLSTKTFISNKINEYRQQQGMSNVQLMNMFMSGAAISPGNPFDPSPTSTAGNLLMTGALATWLTGFLSWLWNGEGNDEPVESNGTAIESYPDEIIQGTIKLKKIVNDTEYEDFPGYYYDARFEPGVTLTPSYQHQTLMMFKYSSNYYTYGSYGKSVYYLGRDQNNGTVYFYMIDGIPLNIKQFRYYNTNGNYTPGSVNTESVGNGWYRGTLTSSAVLQNFPFVTTDPTSITFEGGDVSYAEDPLTFDPSKLTSPKDRFVVGIGDSVKEDEDNPNFPPDVIVGKLPVGDYLEQVAGLYSGVADVNLTIETEEGATVDVPIDLTDVGVLDDAVPVPVDVAAEDSLVVGDSEQVAESTDVDSLDPFTLDLTDFFPFCIPFDIYHMLMLFRDSAEAPHFDWRFYVPNVVDETITIDLSAFDAVAVILRRIELIACGLGLAFVTKQWIQGGD